MHANAAPTLPVSQLPSRVEPLILLQEISHRVINEYAAAIAGIRLAAAKTRSQEARATLNAAADRLGSQAEAHRALQAPLCGGRIDLAEYLQRMCDAITVATLEDRGIRLNLSADAAPLQAWRCWRAALIVSELITNGVRHGLQNGPGHIRVEIETREDCTVCRVNDDGQLAAEVKAGRGVSVVTELAAELGGAVSWRSDVQGTTAELIFPNLTEGSSL